MFDLGYNPLVPDVILPVLDEAGALPGLLAALPPGYRPVVVDNGSTDGSAAVAAGLGAEVVSEPTRGFGAACWSGLLASRPADGVVCFMDADGSFDPGELPLVAGPVLAGHADLVLGRRVGGRDAWPPHVRFANRAVVAMLRARTGLRLGDLGPMRAARRDALIGLGLRDRRSGWPLEMAALAAGAGWRIAETPVSYRPRVGRSKVTGTVRGTAGAVLDMGRLLLDADITARGSLGSAS
ncbi:glycosyltransferase family 2 protein [Acidiferrimicrobium sp. IK]|uniref:glycosyltransferase family 2 protein n=1 Tax=Acidiferrimicrobium sp. IK TaxID=2871700 RepID=UPI0021CB2838|nr:glycosyltransferase family 2 protein [Acidiferrimicrobium sp. IK]MCU4184866.1 glycosyltransferase family 2 protein [Acidiferrimicrobium sp. IK]